MPLCLLDALPLPMLTFFLVYCSGEDPRRSRLLRAVFWLWAIYCVLVLSGLFTEAFFLVTPDRQTHRGPWYPFMLIPVTVTVLMQLFINVFLLIGACTVLFALSMYGFILSEQIERDISR